MATEPMILPPKVNPPLCPHCEEVMTGIALFFWVVSGWLVSATNCPACGRILNTQMMPMEAGPPPDASRIQMPS